VYFNREFFGNIIKLGSPWTPKPFLSLDYKSNGWSDMTR
jgi:hypothetical protein